MRKPVCAVVGAGPGNGLSLARRFSEGGYQVAMLARDGARLTDLADEVADARAVPCDVTLPEQVEAAFEEIEETMGPVGVLVYNAGSGSWGSVDEVSLDAFEDSWRVNAYGLLLCARQVLPGMRELGCGAIAVIGAGAAWRGRAGTAAFAAAKAAQRSLAQSLARHVGREGIHVCYAVIDGVVDTPRTRAAMPDKPDTFFLSPDAIAEAVWTVVQQPRSAWTFELDLRPFSESW